MNLEKTQIKYLLVLALLALTLPMAAWLVSRPQLIQKQAACAVNLKLDPPAGSHPKNTPFDVALKIEAGTVAVTGADVALTFDASKIKINSITLGTGLNVEIVKTINNTNGTARIVAVKTTGAGVTGTFSLATLRFEGLVAGSVPVTVSLGNAQITASGEGAACSVGTKTNGSYTITAGTGPTNTPRPPTPTPTGGAGPTPTPTGSIAPTPTPTGGAEKVVNFRVKTRGITSAREATPTLNFRAKFVWAVGANAGMQAGPVYTVQGTTNSDGAWTIRVPLTAETPGGLAYNLYIKGPMHLQKKFPNVLFAADPQESSYDLTTLGLRYYLDPGDLPIGGPNHDQQDGVVNSLDAVYLTGCFETPDDATCLAKADLNLDGIISTMDMELMNGTVYSKWEDEVE